MFTPYLLKLEPTLGLGPVDITYTMAENHMPINQSLSGGAKFMMAIFITLGVLCLFGILI